METFWIPSVSALKLCENYFMGGREPNGRKSLTLHGIHTVQNQPLKEYAMKGAVAIISKDTLANLGLKSIFEKLIPNVDVSVFYTLDEMLEKKELHFVHYFVSWQVLSENPIFFVSHKKQTLVMASSESDAKNLPSDFRTLRTDVALPLLVRQILGLLEIGHHHFAHLSMDAIPKIQSGRQERDTRFTSREMEVLRSVARGRTSKEIADELGVSLSTVFAYRKNLMEKTGAHSATKLVVYAVTHGYVRPEDII